jgi:hypothetical protein
MKINKERVQTLNLILRLLASASFMLRLRRPLFSVIVERHIMTTVVLLSGFIIK